MDLIAHSIRAPVGVAVGVIFVVLFGALALTRIPVQLTPDIEQPRITVQTVWPGASPLEVEREIVDRQEEQLKGVEGLVRMTSESQDSVGSIVMEFPVGADIDAAILKVANKLDQVRQLPELADRPVIVTVDVGDNAVAWMVLQILPGNERDINSYRNLCEEVIKPAFERVQGVAQCNLFGGTEQQLVVTVDPLQLSAHGITIDSVIAALRRSNRNVSAGDYDEGKRRYIARVVGEFEQPSDLDSIVVTRTNERTVYLRDVASVELGFEEADFTVRRLGSPSIALNCQRSAGANVLSTMKGIRKTLDDLNREVLPQQGLKLEQVYDETVYIYRALALVRQNILIGGLLAIVVLILFLRSRSSVTVVATAIPISIVGTFLVLFILGRNINVISLAGMSFAVGMVVDNAIVVLENIFRHREMGKQPAAAALEGAREVRGAVLASTLTTMAVFIPILFMKEEIGQLYRDIALAISSAVALSMVVSLTVIPVMASRLMRAKARREQRRRGAAHHVDRHAGRFAGFIADTVYRLCGRVSTRVGIALVLTLLAFGLSWLLLPSPEYLPQGNQNLVFGILLPPPGYNLDTLSQIGGRIERALEPHFPEYEGKPRTESIRDPAFEHFFFVAAGRSVFMGARAQNPAEVGALVPLMRGPLSGVPGMIGIVSQTSLFGRSIGQGRSIELEITGPDLTALVGLAQETFGRLMGLLPTSQMRPIPSLDLGNPELNIVPDRLLAAKVGLSAEQIGVAVDVLLDGRKVDDFKYQGEELDLVVEGREEFATRSQDFELLPIATPSGKLVTLGSVANLQVVAGPEQINHLERKRAITLSIVPPEDVPLSQAMRQIREQIVEPLQAQGRIGGLYGMRMAGTADDLAVARQTIQWNFLLAVVISFLLMAALFESFLYPLVIMFSVPLAAVGGLLGLRVVNLFVAQPLDTLTMLGFIILVGTVVNNAILIVHQALNLIRGGGLSDREAIRESVRTRIRPIFMSTTTSMLGMSPLVLFPGAGSELYRGIGSVVIGGLLVSTVFTLVLVPTLFSLALGLQRRVSKAMQRVRGTEA